MTTFTPDSWKEYCEKQLTTITPMLADAGILLDAVQPHIEGERYVLSGPKLVLFGKRREDNVKVVVKITDDPEETKKLEEERNRRELLHKIQFAYRTFLTPSILIFGRNGAHTFMVSEYIAQDKPFLDRPLTEQFFIALRAFEAQEGSHATAYSHVKSIEKVFELLSAEDYVMLANTHRKEVSELLPEYTATQDALARAGAILIREKELIGRYCGFLTHWDFVPHNFRIRNNDIYLLDHSAIRFGNKYEGWARFSNFMALYNPELETAITAFVRDNRHAEESDVLRLMRMYRLGELIRMHASIMDSAEGDLVSLSSARVDFWTAVLQAQLDAKPVHARVIAQYREKRDSLRDDAEKNRQKDLH